MWKIMAHAINKTFYATFLKKNLIFLMYPLFFFCLNLRLTYNYFFTCVSQRLSYLKVFNLSKGEPRKTGAIVLDVSFKWIPLFFYLQIKKWINDVRCSYSIFVTFSDYSVFFPFHSIRVFSPETSNFLLIISFNTS